MYLNFFLERRFKMVTGSVRTRKPKLVEVKHGQKIRYSVISWVLKALRLEDLSPTCTRCWTHVELKAIRY